MTARAALALLALIACGCGGGHEDFAAEAEVVCDEARAQLAELEPGPTEMEEVSSTARAQLAVVERALSRLRGLDPPAEASAWLDSLESWRDTLVRLGEGGRGGQLEERLLDVQRRRTELARAAGLGSCGHL